MERSWLILSLLMTLTGWLAHANGGGPVLSCASLFEERNKHYIINEVTKIKGPEVVYSLKLKTDDRFNQREVTKESLVELFQMLGQTQFFNTSEKITLEKGTLYLGRAIDAQISAQAEYTYDKPNQSLHLTRISLINSKNGLEHVLTKEPLDYSGTKLVKEKYTVVFEKGSPQPKIVSGSEVQNVEFEAGPLPQGQKIVSLSKENVRSAEFSFPSTISGTAFEKINKWSLLVPHLKHAEIDVVDSVNKQRWAVAKGQYRRAIEFAKDRFLKQAFGLIVVFAIFEGASGFSDDVAKYFVDVAQSQEATVSVRVRETKVDGNTTNTEQRFKINLPKKTDPNAPIKEDSSIKTTKKPNLSKDVKSGENK